MCLLISEQNFHLPLSQPLYFLRHDPSQNLKFIYGSKATDQRASWILLVPSSSSPLPRVYGSTLLYPGLFIHFRNPNSGPHACVAASYLLSHLLSPPVWIWAWLWFPLKTLFQIKKSLCYPVEIKTRASGTHWENVRLVRVAALHTHQWCCRLYYLLYKNVTVVTLPRAHNVTLKLSSSLVSTVCLVNNRNICDDSVPSLSIPDVPPFHCLSCQSVTAEALWHETVGLPLETLLCKYLAVLLLKKLSKTEMVEI